MFQEDLRKEMLESSNLVEGPILEGDQKYFFKLVQDIPDNRNFNINIGRIRVDSGAESDEMVSLSDFTSCLVKKLGCLCGKTAVLA